MAVVNTIILGMLVLGFVLIFLESIAPGMDLVVVGLSLFISGLTGWVLPFTTVPLLILVFIVTTAPLLYAYHNYVDFDTVGSSKTSTAEDLEYSKGVTISEITSTSGRVRLEDAVGMSDKFQARCKDGKIEEGVEVVVTDAGGGSVLEVMPEYEINSSLEKESETN